MNTRKQSCSRLTDLFQWMVLLFSIGTVIPANAFTNYLTDFNNAYNTTGTRLDSCGLCHTNFNGGGTRTSYGEDFLLNNYSITAIGTMDSDSDGVINNDEVAAGTLTFPGLTCNTLVDTTNAPADLADYVDPGNPGCVASGQIPVVNANGPYVTSWGVPVNFSSAGTIDPDGTIVSYLWHFGYSGITSTEANPVFAYNITFQAQFVVTLTVTDNDGNIETASTTVLVLSAPNDPPTADAGPAVSGSVNELLQFNGSASFDPEGDTLLYTWDFGDGSTGTRALASHAYSRCGTYTTTLTVADFYNLKGTATTTATIASSGIDAPVANAGGGTANHYDGSTGSNVQFDGSASADIDCDIMSYNWDFGDGTTGVGMNPAHSYTLVGDYVVTLTVTDNDGLSASHTATVTIVDGGTLDGAALYDTNCGGCHGLGANSTKAGATVQRINDGIATVSSMNSLGTLLSAAEIQAIADYLATIAPQPQPTDGPTLYANNCAACHGAGDTSTKAGATVQRINDGIATVTSMNSLATTLSATDIQAIADYLATITPPQPPTGGSALYDTYCAACHGPGDNSTKAGATVTRIDNGIATVTSMNSLATTLTAADIQAIADFLTTTAPPTTPEGLYATYCGACHGADGSGGTSGQNVIGDSASKISSAIQSENEMQYLSILTNEEIQLISDFLNGVTSPPTGGGDGTALYDTYCAACHGVGANSTKAGATVQRINDGIATVGSMNSLATTLTTADVQAIADYLATLTPTTPVGGAALYDTYCAACHGASDNSTKAGATVTRIENGISTVSSMNSLATTLSATDIQDIADFLATVAPPSTPEGLYVTYCAACHGVDASGGSSGKNVQGDSTRDIRHAIEDERDMRYLNFLSYEEIQSIANHLDTL